MKRRRINPLRSQTLDYGAVMAVAAAADSEKQQATWRGVGRGMKAIVNSGVSNGRFAARRDFLSRFISQNTGHILPITNVINQIVTNGYYFGLKISTHSEWPGFHMTWVYRKSDVMHVFACLVHEQEVGVFHHLIHLTDTEDIHIQLRRWNDTNIYARFLWNGLQPVPKERAKELLLAVRRLEQVFAIIISIAKDLRASQHLQEYTVRTSRYDSVDLMTPHGQLHYRPGRVDIPDSPESFLTKTDPSHRSQTSTLEALLSRAPGILRYKDVYENVRRDMASHLQACHVEDLI